MPTNLAAHNTMFITLRINPKPDMKNRLVSLCLIVSQAGIIYSTGDRRDNSTIFWESLLHGDIVVCFFFLIVIIGGRSSNAHSWRTSKDVCVCFRKHFTSSEWWRTEHCGNVAFVWFIIELQTIYMSINGCLGTIK